MILLVHSINIYISACVLAACKTCFERMLKDSLPVYHINLKRAGLLEEYVMNAPALCNALWSTIFAVYCIIRGTWSTPYMPFVYFAMDGFYTNSWTMRFHHLIGIVLLSMGNGHPFLAPFVLFTECSTIYLCCKCMIKGHHKMPRKNLSPQEKSDIDWLSWQFRVVFVLSRLVILPCAMSLSNLDGAPRAVLCSLLAINYYWFFKGVMKKFLAN